MLTKDEPGAPKLQVPRDRLRRRRHQPRGEISQQTPFPPLKQELHIYAFTEDILRLVEEKLSACNDDNA